MFEDQLPLMAPSKALLGARHLQDGCPAALQQPGSDGADPMVLKRVFQHVADVAGEGMVKESH